MKRKINNKNKMFLKKFIGSKKIIKFKNDYILFQILSDLFNKKVSFLLQLRKNNKSYGTVYKVFYNKETNLYGNTFEKQNTSKTFAFDSIFKLICNYNPDFLRIKTKKSIHSFNKYLFNLNSFLIKKD